MISNSIKHILNQNTKIFFKEGKIFIHQDFGNSFSLLLNLDSSDGYELALANNHRSLNTFIKTYTNNKIYRINQKLILLNNQDNFLNYCLL